MICTDCVTPSPLKIFIQECSTNNECSYCSSAHPSVENRVLFEHILKLVDENVAMEDDLTSFESGMLYHCGSDMISVATIDRVLGDWMGLYEEEYFDELIAFIPPNYLKNAHGEDRHFYFDDGTLDNNLYEARWESYVDDIRHSYRFFNPRAGDFLEKIFGFLSNSDKTLKEECVRTVDRGEYLYRARLAPNSESGNRMMEKPIAEFGLAPKERVGSQRMTPHGIPALYCAFERDTCLSEIRSITGDIVASAAFTPTRALRLLDLTKLEKIEGPKLSLLDSGYRDSINLQTFIRSLVRKMSRPKGRSDELLYLSTQVAFEFLRLKFSSVVHGLVFPSVQTGEQGTNLVLFPEFCKISDKEFEPNGLDEAIAFDAKFGTNAYLAFVSSSVEFHKIKAIHTVADSFDHPMEAYLSDKERSRLPY